MGNTKSIHIQNSILNIKSKYILKQIMDNITHLKVMEIIKYNKIIQQKMELGINDYYKEFIKQIKIEIIPKQNEYGCIIRGISNSHIYFNGETIEKKRNIIYEGEKVEKIKIEIDTNIMSFKDLFKDCKCIESINFIKFNKKDIFDMSYMFYGCTSLKEANLSNLITENVTDMSFMFYNCTSLKEVNLSNFNTKRVKNMKSIFSRCSSLQNIDLSNFDTQNVEDMSYIFYDCSCLREIDLSKFKTKKVINMSHMFKGCQSLIEINIPNFDFRNVKDTQLMFYGCTSLKSLDVKAFEAKELSLLFQDCSKDIITQFKDNLAKEKNKKDCIIF